MSVHEWTDEEIVQLRALWRTAPVRVIAAKMRMTPNQLIRKAHRLDLPRHENPVKLRKPDGPHHRPGEGAAARTGHRALPSLSSLATEDAGRPAPAYRTQTKPAPVAVPDGFVVPCRWPLWPDSKRPSYRQLIAGGMFCEVPSLPGGSWCHVHKRRVFTARQSQGN